MIEPEIDLLPIEDVQKHHKRYVVARNELLLRPMPLNGFPHDNIHLMPCHPRSVH